MLHEKQRLFKIHPAISLEALVPQDNFYRQLEAQLDLSFVRDLVADYYTSFGRPSIDPIVFFKLHLIMFFEGIRSERKLMETVKLNLAHRWYIGYDLDEAVPDHSSLSKIRDRYGLEVFQRFFEQIIELCVEAGLVWGRELYFDGTMVRANADYERRVPRLNRVAQEHLQEVFTPDKATGLHRKLVHKYDGTQPLVRKSSYQRQADYWVSPVDPSATSLGHQRLGYHLYYGIDGGKARIILNCLVTPATIQDNMPLLDLAWWSLFRWQLPLHTIVADGRYGTIDNVVGVERNGIRAFFPLHAHAARTRSTQNVFPASAFQYDPQQDCYVCPQGKRLPYYNTDFQNQRHNYKAPEATCSACPVCSQCVRGKHGRRISHSMFKAYLDRVQAYSQTEAYQKAMRKRQVWVEPKFAELKEWHCGRRFRLRGLLKVNMEALLKASGQNIKQLLKARNRTKPLLPAESAVGTLGLFYILSLIVNPLFRLLTFSTLWNVYLTSFLR
jgi:transposase